MAVLSRAFFAALMVFAFTSVGLHGANAQGIGKEEILVTSQKREQRVQDVPIAVSAFTAQQLRDRNAALDAEVVNLKQGLEAAEERARTDLGMIGRKETFYQVVPAAESRD